MCQKQGRLDKIVNDIQWVPSKRQVMPKSEYPCRSLTHCILVGIKTDVDEIWWSGVRMCPPTISISKVQFICVNQLLLLHLFSGHMEVQQPKTTAPPHSRVEMPITNHLRDSTLDLKKYKGVQIFSMQEYRNHKDCSFFLVILFLELNF